MLAENRRLPSPSHLWHVQDHPESPPDKRQQRELGDQPCRVVTVADGESLRNFTFLTQPGLCSCLAAVWKFSQSDHF